jgi:hypothetical protein
MRIFHEIVYDGYANASNSLFSNPMCIEKAGAVDMIHISGYASQVVGTSPTLTVTLLCAAERNFWFAPSTPPINGIALSTTQETLFQGAQSPPAGATKFQFVQLQLTLGGTSPGGHFRIWITGRDLSRRAHSIVQTDRRKSGMVRSKGAGSGDSATLAARARPQLRRRKA